MMDGRDEWTVPQNFVFGADDTIGKNETTEKIMANVWGLPRSALKFKFLNIKYIPVQISKHIIRQIFMHIDL